MEATIALADDYNDPKVYGAVVVIQCRPTKRFLVLRELESNPRIFKVAGMKAFPSETSKPEDKSDVLATIRRAAKEETGLSDMEVGEIFLQERPLEFRHKVPIFAGWTHVREEFTPANIDPAVEFYGWLSEKEIRLLAGVENGLRIETVEVLDVMKRGKGGATV